MERIRKRNGRWQARYRGPDGKERTKTFDRQDDAEKWVTAGKASLVRGDWLDPRKAKITFAEVAQLWASAQFHEPATVAAVESRMRKHILPKWGDQPIRTIQRTEVEGWVQELARKLAPSTVGVVFAHFRTVMFTAERNQLIVFNPAKGIKRPRVSRRRVIPFDQEEVAALLEAAGPRWRGALALGIGSGLRSAELRAVASTPDSLEWAAQRVHVARQWDQTSQQFKGYTKTEAGMRTVPLASWVTEELSQHCSRNGVGVGDLLFTTIAGRPLRRSQLSEMIQSVAAKAGIVRPEDDGRIVFHDCRHTFASSLIRAGLNPKMIQTYLGHASITETFDTYGHLFPADEDAAREALERLAPNAARGLHAVWDSK